MFLETSQVISQVVKDTAPVVTSIIRDTVFIQQNNYETYDLAKLIPLATALVAIISVIVSNINTKKQLQISERQFIIANENFEKQLEADRERMKHDNMIRMRKEWIQDFSKISCLISELLYKLTMKFHGTPDGKIEKVKESLSAEIDQLQLLDSQLKLKITLEGEELTPLHLIFDDFIAYIFVDTELNAVDLKAKLAAATMDFEREAQNIIRNQIAKIVE